MFICACRKGLTQLPFTRKAKVRIRPGPVFFCKRKMVRGSKKFLRLQFVCLFFVGSVAAAPNLLKIKHFFLKLSIISVYSGFQQVIECKKFSGPVFFVKTESVRPSGLLCLSILSASVSQKVSVSSILKAFCRVSNGEGSFVSVSFRPFCNSYNFLTKKIFLFGST